MINEKKATGHIHKYPYISIISAYFRFVKKTSTYKWSQNLITNQDFIIWDDIYNSNSNLMAETL